MELLDFILSNKLDGYFFHMPCRNSRFLNILSSQLIFWFTHHVLLNWFCPYSNFIYYSLSMGNCKKIQGKLSQTPNGKDLYNVHSVCIGSWIFWNGHHSEWNVFSKWDVFVIQVKKKGCNIYCIFFFVLNHTKKKKNHSKYNNTFLAPS